MCINTGETDLLVMSGIGDENGNCLVAPEMRSNNLLGELFGIMSSVTAYCFFDSSPRIMEPTGLLFMFFTPIQI